MKKTNTHIELDHFRHPRNRPHRVVCKAVSGVHLESGRVRALGPFREPRDLAGVAELGARYGLESPVTRLTEVLCSD